MDMMATVITKSKHLESGFPITVALQVFPFGGQTP
jgi:hypothetical protein